MLRALRILISTVRAATRTRADLLLEVTALRQQVDVYRRQATRPKLQRRLSRRHGLTPQSWRPSPGASVPTTAQQAADPQVVQQLGDRRDGGGDVGERGRVEHRGDAPALFAAGEAQLR